MNTTTDKVPLSIESRKVLARLSITYIVLQRNRLLSKQYYKLANTVISSLNIGGEEKSRDCDGGKELSAKSTIAIWTDLGTHQTTHSLGLFVSCCAAQEDVHTSQGLIK